MSIIAAFRWEPSGKNGYISYMLLNDQNYKLISGPEKIVVKKNNTEEIENALNNFFKTIRNSTNDQDEITVECKTVIRRSPNTAHRDDSAYIHAALVGKILENSFKYRGRLLKDLDGSNLRKFKMKLCELGIIDSDRGNAWIHRLWAVALHITPATLKNKLGSLETKFKKDKVSHSKNH